MPSYRFHNTPHFVQRISERNLSLENVRNVVKYPDSQKVSPNRPQHGGKVHIFEKTVDGSTLKVVAEIKAGDCWLITAYEPA